jgi:hypothetical protein
MITREEVEKVQEKWGRGLVNMGLLTADSNALEKAVDSHLEQLYAFDQGTVLFKPTMAAVDPFRLDKEGARSYFIGGCPSYTEDTGFALKKWKAVRFVNAEVILEVDRAIAMGTYFFMDEEGLETRVEYTFGYVRVNGDALKINLHHSSLPFNL